MQLDVPVVGILRGVTYSFFGEIMKTSFASGLQAIEVTMNTDNADKIISGHLDSVPKGKFLGMGTIRNIREAETAIDAGAMFLVSPNTDTSVIEYAKKRGVPIIAGALTPTEVYTAWAAGAAMVKVFPCAHLGPGYIREILGPFDHIPLVAVGGIDNRNLSDYFMAGADAVGASSALFGRKAMAEENFNEIAENVKKFIELCNKNKRIEEKKNVQTGN
jgi:2-dehydro-3-deoxyphosphogluconate aldolase/(4S)-4-hydroxy-2-oxoglutarate aldolase